MVTVPADSPAAPDQTTPPVAYRYGWRYVRRDWPDGGTTIEQVPLTLEDVLHPQEGDQVTESVPHERRRRYLADVLTAQLAGDPTAVVLSDVLVIWDVPGLRPHGPDIAVILGVRERKPWRSFTVAAEGVRPALIIELTSPETPDLDRSRKLEHYEQAGVIQYVIVDAVRGEHFVTPRLLGYRLGPGGYQGQALDERGRLWLEAARTWLGVEGDEIVCYDEADRVLGDYRTLVGALTAAEQRAAAAEQRAAAEAEARAAEAEARAATEARLRAAEEELRRLRG
jgi:colicin import membrane protein